LHSFSPNACKSNFGEDQSKTTDYGKKNCLVGVFSITAGIWSVSGLGLKQFTINDCGFKPVSRSTKLDS